MTKVNPLDIVWWYRNAKPTEKPCLAIVTDVGASTVSLSIIVADRMMLDVREGVPHMDDPRAQHEHNDAGAWVHRPERVQFQKSLDEIAGLRQRVETLMGVGVVKHPGRPRGRPRKQQLNGEEPSQEQLAEATSQ